MPFTFEIDTAAGIIREFWTDRVDIGQLKDSCRQQWAHPDYKPGKLCTGYTTRDAASFFHE